MYLQMQTSKACLLRLISNQKSVVSTANAFQIQIAMQNNPIQYVKRFVILIHLAHVKIILAF